MIATSQCRVAPAGWWDTTVGSFQVIEGQLDGVDDQAVDAEAVVGEVGGGEGLLLG